MIVETPRIMKITSKRSFAEAMEVEEEDSKASKRKKTESEKDLVEVGSKKMKEKFQGSAFEVQEYNFSETREGSSDKLNSRSDL